MADSVYEEKRQQQGKGKKLAAAKKKLRQFQQAKSSVNTSPRPDSPSPTKTKSDVPVTNGSSFMCEDEPAVEPSNTSVECLPVNDEPPVKEIKSPPDHNTDQLIIEDLPPEGESGDFLQNGDMRSSNERLSESTEQLHQISLQINGLITETGMGEDAADDVSCDLAAAESRNRQLAAMLEQQQAAGHQLQQQLAAITEQTQRAQAKVSSEKSESEVRASKDIKALKDQLQVHIQTIGILVSEKTELQASLNTSQKAVEQRVQENEQLSGRLKASRQRVAELECSFTQARTAAEKHESQVKELSRNLDRLKLELYTLSKQSEEQEQERAQLGSKLASKVAECAAMEDQLIDVRGKLELAEVHIAQLSNVNSHAPTAADVEAQLQQLLAERAMLVTRLQQYEESVSTLSAERQQMADQYQYYADNLTHKMAKLEEDIAGVIAERDNLLEQTSQLEASLLEVSQREESVSDEAGQAAWGQREAEARLSAVQQELMACGTRLEGQVRDNEQLSRLLAEREAAVLQLQTELQRLSESAVDHEALLDTMQSDKTALSRAIAQNKELKSQLAELQNGFVKMSNENMDVMTSLTSEQHVSKELAERLAHQEEELGTLREDLTEKDAALRSALHAADVEGYTHQQLEDRLRHLEARGQLVDTLQRELNHAQDTINSLTNQNAALHSHVMSSSLASSADSDITDKSGQCDSLNASIQQLELERNGLLERLAAETGEKSRLELQVSELQAQDVAQSRGVSIISPQQYDALQHAMGQLESKYTTAMHDKAELSDKSERLEHIIGQLQGETDTIGEYVALYQQQRSLLKQRQYEKDGYISQLARERQSLTEKLAQLQSLVLRLLQERNVWYDQCRTSHESAESTAFMDSVLSSENIPLPDVPSPHGVAAASQDATSAPAPEAWPDLDDSDDTHPSSPPPPLSTHIPPSDLPEDNTARQILSLLTELGHSTNSGISLNTHIYCPRCVGPLLVL